MNSLVFLEKLFNNHDLSSKEIQIILRSCLEDELTEAQIAAFLIGLRMKGETEEEIFGLIQGMRKYMVHLPITASAIDTCGTGGDGIGTFNISTAVALVVSAAGVPIIKHGNKAASSQCGSADVLSELGVHIMLTPEQAKKVFEKVGVVFLLAPLYHPAMKKIAPIRKALQTRTVFNYLGPFLNPAGVKRQIVGVPSMSIAKKLANVAKKLSYENLLIVSSEQGMDEIDITGSTTIFEIKGSRVVTKQIVPEKFGFKRVPINYLKGGDVRLNAQIIIEILAGKKSARRDIVVFNSAYALLVAGKVNNVTQGIALAESVIDNGAAYKVLNILIKETKKYEGKN